MRASALLVLCLPACLERTTGEDKALDPRFLEQTVEQGPAAGAISGPVVKLRGVVESPEDHAIDVDISLLDAAAPGGRAQVGKVSIDAPGAFEIEIPAGKAGVTVALFQDLAADGPTAEDPYASFVFAAVSADQEGLRIPLQVGAFQRAATHQDAAPGAPGGASTTSVTVAPLEGRGPVGVQPFSSDPGVVVTVRGAVHSVLAAPVDLVVSLGEDEAPAGRMLLAEPGAFELQIPRGAGPLRLQALQDLGGDGAGAEDPTLTRTLTVGEVDIDGVELVIPVSEALVPTGTAPAGEPAQAPPGAADPSASGADGAAVGSPPVVEHREMPPGGSLDPAAGLAGPFDAYDGPTVVVSGTVLANDALPVDLDLRVADETAESGVRDLGKVLLTTPGPFSIRVPVGLGDLRVEAFQDPERDGPDADDPWGVALVEVGPSDVADVRLMLVAGARGTPGEHQAVAHVEAGEGAALRVDLSSVGRPVDPSGVGPFANHRGGMVKLRGMVTSATPGPVDLDLWVQDPAAPGGLRNQGKVVLVEPGAFTIRVPRGAGRLAVEAYQDVEADGPTEVDLFARVEVDIGAADVEGLALALAAGGSRGGAVGAAPAPARDRMPFLDAQGPRVKLAGVVRGDLRQPVLIDVRVPDAAAPGGVRQEGQLHLEGPGVFEFEVPRDQGALELEAFQDQDANGPDDDDPYGRMSVTVGDKDVQAAIDLVAGGRALAAAAGAPGGAAGPGAAGPGEADAFPAWQGERITISGTVEWAGEHRVDVDLFKTDAAAPGGRSIAGKLKLKGGAFSFTAPKDFGPLELEAFVDVNGDGPSAGDPVGRYAGNPLQVGGEDITGVTIAVTGG